MTNFRIWNFKRYEYIATNILSWRHGCPSVDNSMNYVLKRDISRIIKIELKYFGMQTEYV